MLLVFSLARDDISMLWASGEKFLPEYGRARISDRVVGYNPEKDSNSTDNERCPKENAGPFIESCSMRKVPKQNGYHADEECVRRLGYNVVPHITLAC